MKRVAREQPEAHKHIDFMKPIKYTELGSANDPCFGKHYSIKAGECKRCGDSEMCAILSSQSILTDSLDQESNHRFKDTEEATFMDKQDKNIQKLLENRAKKFPDKYLLIEKALPKVLEKLNLTEEVSSMVRQRILKAASSSKLIKLNKLQTKYKYNG